MGIAGVSEQYNTTMRVSLVDDHKYTQSQAQKHRTSVHGEMAAMLSTIHSVNEENMTPSPSRGGLDSHLSVPSIPNSKHE